LVAGDHPVALDADDARAGVEWGGEGDVWVWVREAGVRGTPGVVVGRFGRVLRAGGGRGVRAEGGLAKGWVRGAGRGRWGLLVAVGVGVALLEILARIFLYSCVCCSSVQSVGRFCRPAVAKVCVALETIHSVLKPSLSAGRSRKAYTRATALATPDDTPFQQQWLRGALPPTPSLFR